MMDDGRWMMYDGCVGWLGVNNRRAERGGVKRLRAGVAGRKARARKQGSKAREGKKEAVEGVGNRAHWLRGNPGEPERREGVDSVALGGVATS